MEKEFVFDQEVVMVKVPEDPFNEESIEAVVEELSAEDYTVADESEIDWSTL